MVYGVAVESSAAPIYGRLQRLHLPKLGYSDILPKYANATGGEIFNGFSRQAIENTYAQLIGDARNQYTLGYVTRATPSSAHREIEVKVARPDLTVVAKKGIIRSGWQGEKVALHYSHFGTTYVGPDVLVWAAGRSTGGRIHSNTVPKSFYRRNLPHLQRDNKPHFLTFCTHQRWILPAWARLS